MAKRRPSKSKFIKAIKNTGGVISAIAGKLQCDWSTAKRMISEDADIERAYDDECEAMLDSAESNLHKLITQSDIVAIKYYLSTKGKARGYIIESKTDVTASLTWRDKAAKAGYDPHEIERAAEAAAAGIIARGHSGKTGNGES